MSSTTFNDQDADAEGISADMIADSVRDLLHELVTAEVLANFEAQGEAEIIWQACINVGLDRATANTEHGGIGLKPSGAFPLLHAVGYFAAPVPVAETLLAHSLLASAGISPPDDNLLIPLDFANSTTAPVLQRCAKGAGKLNASFSNVPWGGTAQWGVAQLEGSDGYQVILVDLRYGCKRVVRTRMTHEPYADLQLNGVDVVTLQIVQDTTPLSVRTLGALFRSAQLVGAIERVLEMTVHYSIERSQFGKSISQYQAVQQILAAAAGAVASARIASRIAFNSSPPRPFDVAVAKVRADEAAEIVAATAHQVHGAIGFTAAHILHHFTQRLWSWRTDYGSGGYWARELGRWAIATGAEAIWPGLVRRSFGSVID